MPSINQPGRVASSKNTAAEILDALTTDQTEFAGGNIDASVSSRARPADTGEGIDWTTRTPKGAVSYDNLVLGNSQQTLLSISGSGFVTGVTVYTGANSPVLDAILDIDGTRVDTRTMAQFIRDGNGERFQGGSESDHLIDFHTLHRFDGSVTITADNNSTNDIQMGAEVDYVLD